MSTRLSQLLSQFFVIAILGFTSVSAFAASVSDLVEAQKILGQINQLAEKYDEVQIFLDSGELTLEVEAPRNDSEGKYVFPYTSQGDITEWADKTLNAMAGAELGEMAGEQATNALAKQVPFGGAVGGLFKSKGKELGAITALGGWDFIRETSDMSFDKQAEFSLYLHSEFSGTDDYAEALSAAMAIYPELDKKHRKTIESAYKSQRKAAKKLAKEKQAALDMANG